jgi:hypothetical protein
MFCRVKGSPRRAAHFALVFLLQSGSEDRLADPKELSFLNLGPVFPENKAIRNVSIDVTPYHIREKEYAFGITLVQINASVVNHTA